MSPGVSEHAAAMVLASISSPSESAWGAARRAPDTRPVAQQRDGNEAGLLLEQHGVAVGGPCRAGRAGDRRQHEGRAHVRMTGERQFRARREDAHPRRVGLILRRQHERGFRQIELRGDRLHLRRRDAARIRHHGERIAAEATLREDIDGEETDFHGMSPSPHPGASAGTPGGMRRAFVACSKA
jgi:hypothetical protein